MPTECSADRPHGVLKLVTNHVRFMFNLLDNRRRLSLDLLDLALDAFGFVSNLPHHVDKDEQRGSHD